MNINPRQERIVELLKQYRFISVSELEKALEVSQVTIRKDLSKLEELGVVIRSHGSAQLADSSKILPFVDERTKLHYKEKEKIAEMANSMIKENQSIFIDSGSTGLLLAEKISQRNLHVVTHSIDVLRILSQSQTVSLTALGGHFRKEAGSFIGPIAVEAIKQMQFEFAFVGATGFTREGNFLTHNAIEGEVKKSALFSARQKVILADSSKFEAKGFAIFAQASMVDLLISDQGFSETETYKNLGIQTILV